MFTSMIIMFVGSFLIQYFLMPPIMVNNNAYITNNIVKVYLSAIMGTAMVTLETIMHDHTYHIFSWKLYSVLAAILVFLIYLYRKQVWVNDKQYLEGMIEHHSMALLTSEAILKKTDNYDVTKLAKKIIQTQTDEIQVMKNLINKIE